MDPEWFELETAGTLIVGWQLPAQRYEQMQPSTKGHAPKKNSIQMAADAATGE